jgi:LPS-assembly protein
VTGVQTCALPISATAQRYDERYTVAEKAMFTACNVCRDDPDQPPLWQVRAKTITHDKEAQEIYYRGATLDFAGVPVMYTPYMSSPDPTVKRRQGFLSPTPGYSPNIGAFVRTPYYVDISPDKDMTISPTFSTTDKAQLAMQYRERFARGDFRIDGSFTKAKLVNDDGVDKGEQWRGHVVGKFAYDVTPIWRAGTDIQYVSDKSYLHRYNISASDQMVSRAYVEGFKGRNYAAMNSYYFQDLRADKDAAQPWVLPSATVSALGQPGQTFGGRWSFDASTLVTQRDNGGRTLANQGPNTRRLSLSGGWQRQFLSSTGLVTTASGLLRTDSYWANNVVTSSSETYDRAMFTRAYQQGSVTFRYPMARNGGSYQHLLEPIVSMTAAPTVRSVAKQPIEDSYTVEFDETNLFSANRFTGNDLIEGGSRVTYGLRNALTTDRKSTRLNSSHRLTSRMPSSA